MLGMLDTVDTMDTLDKVVKVGLHKQQEQTLRISCDICHHRVIFSKHIYL